MLKKLRLKFVLINMSIVTIMLCVILGLVFYFTSANLEAASINMMQNIAANPLHLGVPNEREKDIRLPYFTIQLGLRGERIAAGGGYYDLSDTDFLDDLVNAVFSSPKQLGIIEEYNLRYYRSDMPLNHCLVFADISSERATLNALLGTCGFIGALSFLVFLGISILLSRWAVRPVETAWMQQRQFVADASHELKTPLTVIITNTELAQSNECSESVRRTSLNNIAAVSRQMRNLIEQMLELARADNARGKELSGKVELGKLILNALLTFEPVFFERGRMLEQRVIEDIHVQGSAEQLRQIVDILLDNAQKYSRESGKTWVSLQKNGKKRCLLTVENEGEPLSPQEARDIFNVPIKREAVPEASGLDCPLRNALQCSTMEKYGQKEEMGSTVFLWSFPVCNTIERRPNAVRTAALGLLCVRSSVIYLTSGCAFSVISALCVNMEMLTKHSKQEWRQKHDIGRTFDQMLWRLQGSR